MPKTIKNSFFQKLTFEKLMQAHKRAKKNKTYKSEVIKFELNSSKRANAIQYLSLLLINYCDYLFIFFYSLSLIIKS